MDQVRVRALIDSMKSFISLFKENGEIRFCIDYRKLDSVTIGQAHRLPRVEDILDSLRDAQYFSTLDLNFG